MITEREGITSAMDEDTARTVRLLQDLVRFPTVNPPGDEAALVGFVAGLFTEAGFAPQMFGPSPERQNLVVRVPGRGAAPPLLVYGHADVVGVEGQSWTHPPFDGVLDGGFVWGRGAIDMKGPIAMMLSAILGLVRDGQRPAGDVVFALVSDEENGGTCGAQYLVKHHPGLFAGNAHAIGEMGGFTQPVSGVRFYPIMIGEKQRCSLELVFRGPAGHGSLPLVGGALAKLGRALARLDGIRLPVRITRPVRLGLEGMARHLPFPARALVRGLLRPWLTDALLRILGPAGRFFDPLLHDTVNATIVSGGDTINVVPAEARAQLDGRLLPGLAPEVLVDEVRRLLGPDVEVKVTYFSPGPGDPDLSLFETLAAVLREGDPRAVPIPFVGVGVSDARFFATLGIQTYGFTPMILPAGIDFSRLVHGPDERVPVEALAFGTRAIRRLLTLGRGS